MTSIGHLLTRAVLESETIPRCGLGPKNRQCARMAVRRVVWADGRGAFVACQQCYDKWMEKSKHFDMPRAIVSDKKI